MEKSKAEFEPKPGLFGRSKGYPADFIAEGLDQTRGWFYSMLVLGVALFGRTPYKKVIVNGLVLAEDGQKMSKSKNNFPDPSLLVDRYGADALRYYLLSSPVVHGQDLRFSEKGVDEVTKKLINRLLNVLSFYEMYASTQGELLNSEAQSGIRIEPTISTDVLDMWMIARLNETMKSVTDGLEAGELERAARPLMDLTDDLSTWYLRRSRERFKGDDEDDKVAALMTTKQVLTEVAKLLAPFTPFVAEDIYRRVSSPGTQARTVSREERSERAGELLSPRGPGDEHDDSVHLQAWPKAGVVDKGLLKNMQMVRDIASKALEARMAAKINVRQPLQTLSVKAFELVPDNQTGRENRFTELIKDEVNVKQVVFGAPIEVPVELDTTITPGLKEEGALRGLLRAIQDLRKAKGLSVNDLEILTIETDDVGRALIEKNKRQILSTGSLKDIRFSHVEGEGMIVGDLRFKLEL